MYAFPIARVWCVCVCAELLASSCVCVCVCLQKGDVSLLSASEEAFAKGLGRGQQVALLEAYQGMVQRLKARLQPMAERGQEVTKADIDAIFEELNQQKNKKKHK